MRIPAVVTSICLAMVVAGCADETARLAEPDLDFPYTSPNPVTFDFSLDDLEDEEDSEAEDEEDDTEDEDSDEDEDKDEDSDDEPTRAPRRNAPAPAAPAAAQSGAACAWPAQGEAKQGEEFSTFCDREWARTVTSDGQQYFWQSRGSGWVSIDPASETNGNVCWNKSDLEKAPEAIRNAAVFCDS